MSLHPPGAMGGYLLLAAGALLALGQPALAAKRVEIDKTHQVLRAYEDGRLFLETRISTGRENRTPCGHYRVQGKERMRYSSRYHNAPMPYSVQISGHYFIHGFSSVPNRPASHGCIRVPLTGGNPARMFYEWVSPGTPVTIMGRWR